MWLGICGVGSIVLISLLLLWMRVPLRLLPTTTFWRPADFGSLLAVVACWIAWMIPLDVVGGWFLPNRSRPGSISFGRFATKWIRGVLIQSAVFVSAGLLILAFGRWNGLTAAAVAVFVMAVVIIAFQRHIAALGSGGRLVGSDAAIERAVTQTSRWGFKSLPVLVVDHDDPGFTGGVVGLPRFESVVIPAGSVERLAPQELAVTIARRLEAVRSGSRTRGVLVALVWVLVGFVLSAMLPGAGVTSVGELAMTGLGFTLWTFIGLLTLPTISRQASYAIDRKVIDRGVPPQILFDTVRGLDRWQDDEPSRSVWIETIFHPVPSVENRHSGRGGEYPFAWHAARMTLFVSWACMGVLARAVHCNAGRPDLWVMLPTD
ncbi:MAG: hypothetical protein EA381_06855 [Planctomycetaceae bacterium]|nr:MAG: hypothetical protein EA381_06855 [Planctomycetaceae bacterium]